MPFPPLAFGQDVQLSMAAVQASGSPYSQPDRSCTTLNENVSVPKPGSGQALVRVFGSSVNPVNVDLVEPICEGFGCSAGTILAQTWRASSSRWAKTAT